MMQHVYYDVYLTQYEKSNHCQENRVDPEILLNGMHHHNNLKHLQCNKSFYYSPEYGVLSTLCYCFR